MKNSFIHLLKYHFFNYLSIVYNEKGIMGKSFIDHLSNIIFLGENGITNEIIKEEVDKLNKSRNIYLINEQINNVFKELKDRYKADNINFGIKEEDIKIVEEEEEDGENKSKLKPFYIIKMLYILYKNKKLIPPISEEGSKLLNYFTVKKSNIIEEKKQIKDNDNFKLNKLNMQLINELESFAKRIGKDKMEDEILKNLIELILNFIKFLKIYRFIFIPFLGPSNAGKSTIINGIIGKRILPTNLNECTKRGIIILHINSDDIFLYKADLKEDKDILGHRNYYFKK